MTRLIAVDSTGSGHGLTASPGWELTFSFSEAVGASDSQLDESLKRVYEEAILGQDFHRSLNKKLAQQILAEESLRKFYEQALASDTALAEALQLLVVQRTSDATYVSEAIALLLAHIVQTELQLGDGLRKTIERSVGDQIVLESLLIEETNALKDSTHVEDELLVQAVKLLTESSTVTDSLYREVFRLLQDSMVISESVTVVALKVVNQDDFASALEAEELDRIHRALDAITLTSELMLFFERELYDDSVLADTLSSELFKSVADFYALNDELTLAAVDASNLLITIQFSLVDRFVMKIATRSVGSSRSSASASIDNEQNAFANPNSRTSRYTEQRAQEVSSSGQASRAGVMPVVRFKKF